MGTFLQRIAYTKINLIHVQHKSFFFGDKSQLSNCFDFVMLYKLKFF